MDSQSSLISVSVSLANQPITSLFTSVGLQEYFQTVAHGDQDAHSLAVLVYPVNE